MSTHYIVTNREIIRNPMDKSKYMKANKDGEFIRTDGKEIVCKSIRFGTYSFENENDKGTLSITQEGDVTELEEGKNVPSDSFFDEIYKKASLAKK